MKTPTPTQAAVAAEVRAAAGRANCNQSDLARVLGISPASMAPRWHGRQAYDVNELDMLAAHFDVPITELFGRPADGPPVTQRYLGVGADISADELVAA